MSKRRPQQFTLRPSGGDVTFTIYGKPQGKQRPRLGKHGVYTPKATKRYEQSIAWGYLATRSGMISGPVRLRVECYFPDLRRRDIDNVVKCIMDGLNGIAYKDDSQVVELSASSKLDRDRPRTVVTVSGV